MKKEYWLGIAAVATIALIYVSRKAVIKVKEYMTRAEFIKDFAHVVRVASKGTGLFPSVFMAQAILESSDSQGRPGMSGLTKAANNFFGIKADPKWKGEYVTRKTREVIGGKETVVDAKFRKYNAPEDSFFDRVKFLMQNSRYTKGGVFTAKTPYMQAEALQKSGYATDPKYAELLVSLIKKYDLTKLDV